MEHISEFQSSKEQLNAANSWLERISRLAHMLKS
jgi:hypothetical protein